MWLYSRLYSKYKSIATHDEKTCPYHRGLHLHVQVHGKLDPKVVRIRENLPQESGPLLTDFPDRADLIHGQDLGGS